MTNLWNLQPAKFERTKKGSGGIKWDYWPEMDFHTSVPFLYPLRTLDIFRGYRNGTLAWKGSTVHFSKRNYKNLQQFQQLKTPNKFRTLVSLFVSNVNPLIANSIKWSNNSQTIRRQFADEFLECLLPFCGVGASRGKFCVSTNFTPHFTLLCSICKRL